MAENQTKPSDATPNPVKEVKDLHDAVKSGNTQASEKMLYEIRVNDPTHFGQVVKDTSEQLLAEKSKNQLKIEPGPDGKPGVIVLDQESDQGLFSSLFTNPKHKTNTVFQELNEGKPGNEGKQEFDGNRAHLDELKADEKAAADARAATQPTKSPEGPKDVFESGIPIGNDALNVVKRNPETFDN